MGTIYEDASMVMVIEEQQKLRAPYCENGGNHFTFVAWFKHCCCAADGSMKLKFLACKKVAARKFNNICDTHKDGGAD